MALTSLQRHVCRLLADRRKQSGESYVAGGVALNEAVAGTRRSRDVDLFHDSDAALVATCASDRAGMKAAGLRVETIRELPAFVEARVSDGTETVLVEWVRDSAYRFFPLVEHDVFGLALHPFDLATNKLLAIVGRREPRDWVDIIRCHEALQPLGYLAWAAAGKDLGFSPARIVEECARTRYAQAEIDALEFDGPTPRVATLSATWHEAIDGARDIVAALPAEETGTCVLDERLGLERATAAALREKLGAGTVAFHQGRIRGAFPEVRGPPATPNSCG